MSSPLDAPATVWTDESLSDVTDWRLHSLEEVLKAAKLWDPKEDAGLRQRRPLSACERAHKTSDLFLPCSADEDFALKTQDDSAGLLAWVASSMLPLAWFGHDGVGSYETFLSARSTRTRGESRPISPCHTSSYADCRHPQDNVVIAVPDIPLQGDGRSFLHSTPTFFCSRLGFSQAPKMRALLDNCTNLCLANKAFVSGDGSPP